MTCVIPGPKVKIFARALHSLAKIGEDLYLDAQEEGLSLKSVNLARSAFVSYFFQSCFFESYRRQSGGNRSQEQGQEDNPEEETKCRMSMKAIVTAFKSIYQLDKNVETCCIRILFGEYKMLIRYKCRFKVVKTYLLPFIESDSMNAKYDPEKLNNRFTAPSRVLTEAVLNFLTNQEEVTMSVTPMQFVMRNFVEDEDQKIVRTELTMRPGEFEVFDIVRNSSVTYCLKELRSLISFADSVASPISAKFDDGGDPIIFSLENNFLEGSLVMATLSEEPQRDYRRRSSTENLNQSQQLSEVSGCQLATPPTRSDSNREQAKRSLENDGLPPSASQTPTSVLSSEPIRKRHPDRYKRKKQDDNLDFDQILEEVEREEDERNMAVRNDGDDHKGQDDNILITSPSGSETPKPLHVSKKARYIFQRCFDATFNPAKVPGTEKVLAPDSDED